MKILFSAAPVWLVLADMVYGFVLNVMQSLDLRQSAAAAPKDLPVSPDIAFSGLQVLANGGMILIIGFGLLVLLQLNRTVLRGDILPIGVFRALGLLAVLAFGLPAIWEWLWALVSLAQGSRVVSFANPRYLAVALCVPYCALLCIARLAGWYGLHKRKPPEAATDLTLQ